MTEKQNIEQQTEQQNIPNDFCQQTEQPNDFSTPEPQKAEKAEEAEEVMAQPSQKTILAAAIEEEAEKPKKKLQASAVEFLTAAQKSQVAAYGAQKNGEKAFQMAQKVLEEYFAEPELQQSINAEPFLHKQLMAVRDSINSLNNSLAAEKVGVQLSEEAVRRATAEFDIMQRESDGAATELQRLQKVALQQENAYNSLLAKQRELNARIKQEEEKLKIANAAAMAAKSLLDNIDNKKNEAAALLKEAQDFDKDTRDKYRKLQLSFSQAREDASAIITQLRCLNKDLPFDMEEMLLLYEEGYDIEAGGKPKKKLFGKKK